MFEIVPAIVGFANAWARMISCEKNYGGTGMRKGIRKRICALAVLGMFLTIMMAMPATSDLTDTDWHRDTTNGEVYPYVTSDQVGIGHTNPDTMLHVKTYGIDNHIRVQRTNYSPKMDLLAGGGWVGIDCISTYDELFSIFNDGTAVFHIRENNNVGIGTTSPTGKLDVYGNDIRIRNSQTPASCSASGYTGEIAWGGSGGSYYVYVCVSGDGPGGSGDTWGRAALTTSGW